MTPRLIKTLEEQVETAAADYYSARCEELELEIAGMRAGWRASRDRAREEMRLIVTANRLARDLLRECAMCAKLGEPLGEELAARVAEELIT